MKYQRILLRRYPADIPQLDDFTIDEAEIPGLKPGDVLVRTAFLSMDPFPRLRMNAASRVGPPMQLGAPVEGRGVGVVVESRAEGFRAGDAVVGELGWCELALMKAEDLATIDPSLGDLELHLSGLGASGLTAYFLHRLVGPNVSNKTYVAAPAAGSVGMLVGQLALRDGARVIGVCDGPAQESFLREFGFADVIERSAADLSGEVERACPQGWDVFLDGVGADLHDVLLQTMNSHAQIVAFGFIAGYAEGAPPRYGSVGAVLMKRATLRGFLLADYAAEFDEARTALAELIQSGDLKVVRHIWDGLEAAPAAFASLFQSSPPGKKLVRVTSAGDER